jgi:ABC-type transport system involved in multi-copper enzyme maturation permease subunit
MPLRPLLRLVRNELFLTLRRPSFAAFFFLLSMLMLFEISLQTQGFPLSNPMKSIIPSSLVYSNFIAALYLAYLASSSIAREYEERTMNILLTVPMKRSEVYVGKMASLACIVPLIMVCSPPRTAPCPTSNGPSFPTNCSSRPCSFCRS